MTTTSLTDLNALASHLCRKVDKEKFILLYAYNGTGKTRLSTAFKDLGKKGKGPNTLYFNVFTENLFSWDNDLEGDTERKLKINSDSNFFAGFEAIKMENRIRRLLRRYADCRCNSLSVIPFLSDFA